MSSAAGLRAIRDYYGLRQRELAQWLGVSKSQLGRVETGHDPLPTHARPWLHPWLLALAQAPVPGLLRPAPAPAPPLPPDPDPVARRLLECHYQAGRLHQQLGALEQRRRYYGRRLVAGPVLRATLPPLPTADDEACAQRRRWLARLLEAATDGLHPAHPATGTAAWQLLAARYGAWQHEAALLAAAPDPAAE